LEKEACVEEKRGRRKREGKAEKEREGKNFEWQRLRLSISKMFLGEMRKGERSKNKQREGEYNRIEGREIERLTEREEV
jgi:hypothetical protein